MEVIEVAAVAGEGLLVCVLLGPAAVNEGGDQYADDGGDDPNGA